jgi:hypothetical protein
VETFLLGRQEVRLDGLRHQSVTEHVAIARPKQQRPVERRVQRFLGLGFGKPADPVDGGVVDEPAGDRDDRQDLPLARAEIAHAPPEKTEETS